MIRIKGIDHVVLRVRDLDDLVRFYTEVLGGSVEKRNEPLGLVHVRAGHSQIDLVDVAGEVGRRGGAAPGAEGLNMDHFCLQVEPFDEDSIRAHLEAHGVECGPLEARFGAKGDGPSMYIKDPEGNTVELKGPPAEAD